MDNEKLKIVFISSWYPHKLKPLNGIFVKRHAVANTLDCNVSAIFICSDKSYSIEEAEENEVYTIRGYYKAPKLKIFPFYHIIKFFRYFLMWKKVLLLYKKKNGKPDIINSNIAYPVSVIAALIKFTWKVPYVITEHWSGYFPEDGRYKGFIIEFFSKMVVRHAGAVITPSFKLSRTMQSLGLVNKYYVIPNVVDTKIFTIKPVNPDYPIPTYKSYGHFNFIHISSLSEEKNVPGIIRTFKKFHALYPQSKLTIIWDEEEKQFLDKLKEEPFSEDSGVFLTGKKVGPELAAMLQKADASILFSNFENLPVVMLESLCCGVPVIGTRVGDVPEYINERNGVLIDSKNESQLLDAMEKVFVNSTTYHPEEIRNMVVERVSPVAISKQFLSVYKMVLQSDSTS